MHSRFLLFFAVLALPILATTKRLSVHTPPLEAFEHSLAQIPASQKKCVLQAEQRCHALLTPRLKLAFLRCEDGDAEKAARRYCAYWNKRVQIFGPDLAFLPLTLRNMSRDWPTLRQGFICTVERPKAANYIYIRGQYLDSSKIPDPMSVVRTLWYMVHAALDEDEQVQHKGLAILDYAPGTRFRDLDFRGGRVAHECLTQCLPVKLREYHWCFPPPFVDCILPLITTILGNRYRRLLHVHHSGKGADLRKKLRYFFPESDLPSEVGGPLRVNAQAWLERRRRQRK